MADSIEDSPEPASRRQADAILALARRMGIGEAANDGGV
jgi:hypothetical protein